MRCYTHSDNITFNLLLNSICSCITCPLDISVLNYFVNIDSYCYQYLWTVSSITVLKWMTYYCYLCKDSIGQKAPQSMLFWRIGFSLSSNYFNFSKWKICSTKTGPFSGIYQPHCTQLLFFLYVTFLKTSVCVIFAP